MSTNAKKTKRTLKIPPGCPKCHSTKYLANIPGTMEIARDITGSVDNFHYRRVTWKRKRCPDCKQVIMQRTYTA